MVYVWGLNSHKWKFYLLGIFRRIEQKHYRWSVNFLSKHKKKGFQYFYRAFTKEFGRGFSRYDLGRLYNRIVNRKMVYHISGSQLLML